MFVPLSINMIMECLSERTMQLRLVQNSWNIISIYLCRNFNIIFFEYSIVKKISFKKISWKWHEKNIMKTFMFLTFLSFLQFSMFCKLAIVVGKFDFLVLTEQMTGGEGSTSVLQSRLYERNESSLHPYWHQAVGREAWWSAPIPVEALSSAYVKHSVDY